MRAGKEVARDWVRAIEISQRLAARHDPCLATLVGEMAATHGDRPALIGPGETLSYDGLMALSNQVARWARAQGLVPGDVVCLLMPNCPLYVASWLGLSQAGCVVALLNTNLKPDALAHCIRSAAARHVIANAASAVPAQDGAQWWIEGEGYQPAGFSGDALALTDRSVPQPSDPALLIYSSGTTGLPKATYITHGRILEWSGWFAGMMNVQAADRIYDCLPLYHSTGGIVAVGAMLVAGGSVVIRERFSASRFWDDVADTGCTIFQYIGELCRYLLQSTPPDAALRHSLRLCCGNGMRGDVWDAFQARFAIPQVLEFYAATEGLLSLYNCEGKPGAIGRVPPFLAHRFPLALIACDPDTNEPLRDDAGLCRPCAADQPGEAISQLRSAPRIYTDAAASSRKLLRDVLGKGDCWFRSGDLMRRDAAGFYYFVDRLGDTFRWKGENVSTTEVGAVLLACPGVVDAVAYGVAVPGTEGRAGMAALAVDAQFDLATLRAHIHAKLPSYARPIFVRLSPDIETTATFKHNKVSFARQGYADCADPVWFDDRSLAAFVPLDARTRSLVDAAALNL